MLACCVQGRYIFHAYKGITGSNMIRCIRTAILLLVGIDRTSSSNQFHHIHSQSIRIS